MRVRKDTGVEQARVFCAEEPVAVSKQRVERRESLLCLVVQRLRADDCGELQQLLLSSKTQLARYCEADKGIAGCWQDVEWLGDGREVVREVDAVELESC